MKKTPSKDNNQFGIEVSFPGLCSYCHTEVANFDGSFEAVPGIYRPRIKSLKPIYREAMFELADGSKMVVVLCADCDDELLPEEVHELMESEINGWQKELDDLLPNWSEEKKLDYMEEHAKKFITNRKDRAWTIGQIAKIKKPRAANLKVKRRSK